MKQISSFIPFKVFGTGRKVMIDVTQIAAVEAATSSHDAEKIYIHVSGADVIAVTGILLDVVSDIDKRRFELKEQDEENIALKEAKRKSFTSPASPLFPGR